MRDKLKNLIDDNLDIVIAVLFVLSAAGLSFALG